ncbi:nucleotidyltransferase domain-containing protein [bacterium]|nr:nucleotidyltransferase domain-containing protein [bacterium]
MRMRSSDTVRARFLDGDRAVGELRQVAQELVAGCPRVQEVRLFGSLARGNYAAGSDADVLIVLREDERPLLDRIPEFLKWFLKVSLPVEVFPYTCEEVERMRRRGVSVIKSADREGIRLA